MTREKLVLARLSRCKSWKISLSLPLSLSLSLSHPHLSSNYPCFSPISPCLSLFLPLSFSPHPSLPPGDRAGDVHRLVDLWVVLFPLRQSESFEVTVEEEGEVFHLEDLFPTVWVVDGRARERKARNGSGELGVCP